MRTLARLLGVPFVRADATKFTETGIVGEDAERSRSDNLEQADGDVELAQYGIIYVDEVDKLCRGEQGPTSGSQEYLVIEVSKIHFEGHGGDGDEASRSSRA